MSFVLGLTGSFGSGKSSVAAMLKEMANAVIIDADALSREALAPGSPVLAEVAREFGADLIDTDGKLNRSELASRAFASVAAAHRLNALIHPWVRERENKSLAAHKAAPLVVLDVPLLFEAGMRPMCDQVAVVTIREAERFARLRARGFGEQDVMRRLAFQWPQARKAALADFVIDNSGSPAETRTQVRQLLEKIPKVESTQP